MNLGSISLLAMPVCTGLMPARLMHARLIRHSHTVPLGWGTNLEILHYSPVSFTPKCTIISCYCNLSNSSWRALVVCGLHALVVLDMVLLHLLSALKMCLWSTQCLKRHLWILTILTLLVLHFLPSLIVCWVLQGNSLCLCYYYI